MPFTIVLIVIALALGLGLGPRLGEGSARWLPLVLAFAGALLGISGLLFELVGPSYSVTMITDGPSGGTTISSTRSLLSLGVEPLTAFVIALDALGFATVLVGAFIRCLGSHPRARLLMLAGIVPPVVIGSISFGLASAFPGVVLSLLATILAFAAKDPGTAAAPEA